MIPELNGDFLQWLRGFYYVAKTGSVRKAAELMHRNPSTISYQIKSLEEELGTVLFDRYKKSLIITGEGKKLLGWTISTFETLQSMRSAVGSSDGLLQGDIVFGATLPVAVMAASVISGFMKEHPAVNVRLERHLNTGVVKGVKESRFDFGLTGLTTLPKLDKFDIFLKARPLLVMRRDNAWNLPPVPTTEDLECLPFVVFEPDDTSQVYRPLHTTARSFQKKVAISINNYHLVMQFVRAGLGVGIMDALCYRATLFGSDWSTITCYPLDHILPNVLYGILTRRHKYLTPQAKALMDVIRAHFLHLAQKPLDRMEDASDGTGGSHDTGTER